jgi:hypothetical protein
MTWETSNTWLRRSGEGSAAGWGQWWDQPFDDAYACAMAWTQRHGKPAHEQLSWVLIAFAWYSHGAA